MTLKIESNLVFGQWRTEDLSQRFSGSLNQFTTHVIKHATHAFTVSDQSGLLAYATYKTYSDGLYIGYLEVSEARRGEKIGCLLLSHIFETCVKPSSLVLSPFSQKGFQYLADHVDALIKVHPELNVELEPQY